MTQEPDQGERLNARRLAVALLQAVLDQRRTLDDAWDATDGLAALETRDRAFVRLLAGTVLRRLGELDAVIDACLERPLPAKARPVQHILRLGAAQLLHLGTPAHAAVDTAVELARSHGKGGFAKLVNAVLRRLGRDGAELVETVARPGLNAPDWLWRSWVEAYGAEAAAAIADAHLTEPGLDLTVPADATAWADRLGASVLPTGTLRLAKAGKIDELAGYAEGAWWVQDAAAALPAKLLLGGLDQPTGARIIDLCAAPGGKTAQLCTAGAEAIAVDRSAPRLQRLSENLQRLGLTATTRVADARWWRPSEPAAAVLLDAPCTATGTLRRNPDAAWLKRPGDVARMVGVQAALLRAAAEMVAPGGLLMYCTCSLQTAECDGQVQAFLANPGRAQFVRAPIAADEVAGRSELVDQRGDLRTLPCHFPDSGGMDGFYAARLRRVDGV